MRAVGKAPSKVIMIGEHFVVHGAEAISAAIPIYSYSYAYESGKLEIFSKGYSYNSLKPVERTILSISKEYNIPPKAKIVIKSDVPAGSGLGSSASILVAAASSFMRLNGIDLKPEDILKHSLEGEKEIHSKPSGIDPATCTYGGIIRFRIGEKINMLRTPEKLSILVVNSNRRRKTSYLIKRVARMKEERSGTFSILSKYVDLLVKDACSSIKNYKLDSLGFMMTANHAILSFIGVSTPELDRIVEILLGKGCYGAKLTGAGGGGCVIAIPSSEETKEIQNTLSRLGYDVFNVDVPAGGAESWLE